MDTLPDLRAAGEKPTVRNLPRPGRQARTARRAGVRVRLNARDEAVLSALARFGLARTCDLVRLVFAGVRRDTAARRLRRLFDAGFLEAEGTVLSEENMYRLGPAGRAWAAASGVVVCRAPRVGFEHHLAIVRTWAALARVAHEMPGVSLTSFRPDWDLRGAGEVAGGLVIPDAVVELAIATATGTVSVPLAIEVDLATERLTTLRRKLTNYRHVLMAGDGLLGHPDFGLALVFKGWSAGRKATLTSLLETSWPGWWVSWELAEGPEEAVRQIVTALSAPLTSSPHGEGRQRTLTDEVSVGSTSQGQGLSHED